MMMSCNVVCRLFAIEADEVKNEGHKRLLKSCSVKYQQGRAQPSSRNEERNKRTKETRERTIENVLQCVELNEE